MTLIIIIIIIIIIISFVFVYFSNAYIPLRLGYYRYR
jgi:uncharacterized membrane protein